MAAAGSNGAVGCYYHINTCSNPISNTRLTSKQINVTYSPTSSNGFLVGVSRMVMAWAGDYSLFASYQITSISQWSDSTVAFYVGFSGNPPNQNQYTVAYSYFTLQSFTCPGVGGAIDAYYVYNNNSCDSTCNGWIQQYANALN